MKFQINKFVSAIAVIGAAAALSACGGSDDTVVTAADIPAVTVTASNTTAVAAAKAIATALIDTAAITLPELTATGTAGNIAAGTTLKFTSTTSTETGVLSGFTLTPPTGEALTGVLVAGSCKFRIVTPVARAGQEFVFDPCSFDLNTTGAAATGVTQNVPVAVRLGTQTLTTTLPVTLTLNSTGGVTVSVNGQTIATATVATGATGATGSN